MIWKRHTEQVEEARRARLKAEEELRLTRARSEYFEEYTELLRKMRARNHFGDAIASAFRGAHEHEYDEGDAG